MRLNIILILVKKEATVMSESKILNFTEKKMKHIHNAHEKKLNQIHEAFEKALPLQKNKKNKKRKK